MSRQEDSIMKTRLLPVLLILALNFSSGCGRPSVLKRTVRAKDGTPIVYEIRGKGPTALVFVHCWSCNRNYWRNELKPFSKDFQVVTLDLGGHGESGKERKDWKIMDLAGDVDAVIDDLKADRVVLIGHSMGGPIALKAAADRPQIVAGVACVDTLQNAEQPPPKEMFDSATAKMEADFPKAMKELLPVIFGKNADPKLVQWGIDQALKTDPKIAIALFRNIATLDLKGLMSEAHVPIRCVSAEASPPMGTRTATAVNKKYADFDVIEMANVGHFPMLERPGEFNQKLRQAIDEILKGPSPKGPQPNL
jgi:sigma-B regulation protein RsbQ